MTLSHFTYLLSKIRIHGISFIDLILECSNFVFMLTFEIFLFLFLFFDEIFIGTSLILEFSLFLTKLLDKSFIFLVKTVLSFLKLFQIFLVLSSL